MVPSDSGDSDDSESSSTPTVLSDGGEAIRTGEVELYTTVKGAVKDALLDGLGLLMQLGIGFALVFIGSRSILWSTAILEAVFGVILVVAGVLVAAPVLRLVQPIRV